MYTYMTINSGNLAMYAATNKMYHPCSLVPSLPRFTSSLYVQYNTRKQKSAKNGEALVSFIT